MSLDVSIIAKRPIEIYEGNITYNLAPMYYKAIDKDLGLKKLNGMSTQDAIPILNNAIKDMIKNADEYKKLNPENGWGTYDGLLEQFRAMRNICEENSDGTFEVR
jgi:hypothetical protein